MAITVQSPINSKPITANVFLRYFAQKSFSIESTSLGES